MSQIRVNARLRGPGEARRAIAAVLAELPGPVARELAALLPADLPPPLTGLPVADGGFVARVAARLVVDEPDAAFLCRVVFAELNASPVGVPPARLAHLVPPGLRPLLAARTDDPARLSRRVLAAFGRAHQPFLLSAAPPAEPAEDSSSVVSIRGRAVRPVGEKVDRT